MRTILTAICIALFAAMPSHAQDILEELQSYVPGQGRVTITQSSEVEALVGGETSTSSTDGKTIKTAGYRIQLYSGNNSRAAKDEAYRMAAIAKELFPDTEVYTVFQSPRWLCQFGDFKTIEEADAMMRELEGTRQFGLMSIMRSRIIIKIE